MDRQTLTDVLAAYLGEHFEQVEIREISSIRYSGDDCTSFFFTADGEEYHFNVADEAIAGLDRDAVTALLSNNRVVSVIQDLRGFPVTLTASGCIFGDLL